MHYHYAYISDFIIRLISSGGRISWVMDAASALLLLEKDSQENEGELNIKKVCFISYDNCLSWLELIPNLLLDTKAIIVRMFYRYFISNLKFIWVTLFTVVKIVMYYIRFGFIFLIDCCCSIPQKVRTRILVAIAMKMRLDEHDIILKQIGRWMRVCIEYINIVLHKDIIS